MFTVFFAQSAFSADFKVFAYKGNLSVDSANVYGTKKNWTKFSYTCGNQTIYLGKPVKEAIDRWKAKGYRVETFKIIKGKYIKLCTLK
jgi:hypothetical protein